MIDTSPTVEEVVEVLDKCIIPARQEGFISTLRDGTREARLDRTRATDTLTAAWACRVAEIHEWGPSPMSIRMRNALAAWEKVKAAEGGKHES